MAEQYYVVMEQGFEYDDQNYTRFEGGGTPQIIFTNKKKAEKACSLKNLEEFKRVLNDGYLRDYSYDFEGLISQDATEDELDFEEGIFRTLFGVSAYDWYKSYNDDVELKVEPTEEQWKRLAACFNLQFYYVVTVQKG